MGTRRFLLKAPKKRCPYCKALFDPPTRTRGSPIRFCCADHRKRYHKLGALPFSKLQDQIKREINKRCLEFRSQADHQKYMAPTDELFKGTLEMFREFASQTHLVTMEFSELKERVEKLERDCVRNWETSSASI